MHGSNSTRAELGVYAKRLTDVLDEKQVTAMRSRGVAAGYASAQG
jgi:hypothetical protein